MSADRATTVLLVDNHPILLGGMRALIETADDLSLVGTTATLTEVIKTVASLNPDVIVVDSSLPDMEGFAVIQQLASNELCRGVALLSEIEDRAYVERALQAGVRAYVLKRSSSDCLLHAIRAAGSGGVYLDPAVAANLLANGKQGSGPGGHNDPQLAPREAEVIRLVALGYSIKEIAAQLEVTAKSVETYKARGCEKLQLTSRAHIVRFAAASGWLSDVSLCADQRGPQGIRRA